MAGDLQTPAAANKKRGPPPTPEATTQVEFGCSISIILCPPHLSSEGGQVFLMGVTIL